MRSSLYWISLLAAPAIGMMIVVKEKGAEDAKISAAYYCSEDELESYHHVVSLIKGKYATHETVGTNGSSEMNIGDDASLPGIVSTPIRDTKLDGEGVDN